MKIRNGFVSNSSSSSFVLLGIDLNKYPKLKKKYWNKNACEAKNIDDLPENTSGMYYDCGEEYEASGAMLGWVLGSGSSNDSSFECENVDIDELKKYADELEKVTGIKPKLMGGTYAS